MEPSLFKTIRRIQIQTNHLAKDLFAGLYRSSFKGRGLEFEEVREYQPGDDVRSIDWAVTSHMQHPYVKLFREERELTVMLLVDVSASTRFGSRHAQKSRLIAEVAAVLAFSAIRNNDKVGLILFSKEVEKYIPPRSSVQHVLRVIRELLTFEPKTQGTDISSALSFLGRVEAKSCVCFLFSDFICPDYSRTASLISRRHDLIAVAVVDEMEYKIPELREVIFTDLETGKTAALETSNESVRQQIKERTVARIEAQKKLMNKLGAGFIVLSTDAPYVPKLNKFFKIRSRRPR